MRADCYLINFVRLRKMIFSLPPSVVLSTPLNSHQTNRARFRFPRRRSLITRKRTLHEAHRGLRCARNTIAWRTEDRTRYFWTLSYDEVAGRRELYKHRRFNKCPLRTASGNSGLLRPRPRQRGARETCARAQRGRNTRSRETNSDVNVTYDIGKWSNLSFVAISEGRSSSNHYYDRFIDCKKK